MITEYVDALSAIEKIVGYMTFGRMISSLRKCDELSQVKLARKMKISRAMLCDIEKGRRSVSLKMAKRFAKVMGYSDQQFAAKILEDLAREAGYKAKIVLEAA